MFWHEWSWTSSITSGCHFTYWYDEWSSWDFWLIPRFTPDGRNLIPSTFAIPFILMGPFLWASYVPINNLPTCYYLNVFIVIAEKWMLGVSEVGRMWLRLVHQVAMTIFLDAIYVITVVQGYVINAIVEEPQGMWSFWYLFPCFVLFLKGLRFCCCNSLFGLCTAWMAVR